MSAWIPLGTNRTHPGPSHAEDSQPNEQINKRASGHNPPLVRTSVPPPVRGNPYLGRGGHPQRGLSRGIPRGGQKGGQPRQRGPPRGDVGASRPWSRHDPNTPGLYHASGLGSAAPGSTRTSSTWMRPSDVSESSSRMHAVTALERDGHAGQSSSSGSHESAAVLKDRTRGYAGTAPLSDGLKESAVSIRSTQGKPFNAVSSSPSPTPVIGHAQGKVLSARPRSRDSDGAAGPPPVKRARTDASQVPLSDQPIVTPANTQSSRQPPSDQPPSDPLPMRTSSPPTVIKQERSPSPTVSARFLQTSGAKYFGPLPANCVKGAPGYDKNRKAWAAREARRMERKSFLKTGRMFIREDGLVIEWTSERPVWSDSLLPVAAKHLRTPVLLKSGNPVPGSEGSSTLRSTDISVRQPVTERKEAVVKIEDDDINMSTLPVNPAPQYEAPRQASLRLQPATRISTVTNDGEQSSDPEGDSIAHGAPLDVPKINEPGGGHLHGSWQSSGETSFAGTQLSTKEKFCALNQHASPEAVEELHSAAVVFIERFLRLFDSKRGSLAGAYARHATFSCSVGAGPLQPFWTAEVQSVKQGRSEVISSLLSLKSTYQLPAPIAHLKHDVAVLDHANLVLAIVDGTLCDSTQKPEHRILFRHAFVLKHRDWLGDGEGHHETLWPLVAVSHQLTVRDIMFRWHLL